MTALGRPKLYLGIKFAFDESGTWMHMHHNIEKLLQKFGMECSPLRIPMNLGQVLRKDMHAPLVDQQLYCRIVGSLLFATNLRPDIQFAVNFVSRYLESPQEPYMVAAKNIPHPAHSNTWSGQSFPAQSGQSKELHLIKYVSTQFLAPINQILILS